MAEFEKLVKRIAAILDRVRLNYVIVGGFATILRGRPRTTTDLDLIIENNPERIESFLKSLTEEGFDVMENQVRMAIDEGTNASIFDKESPLRIDLKVAKKGDDLSALTSAVKESYLGISIRVASVEQILFGKVLYLGDINDVPDSELLEYQDVRDFVNVFREQQENVNFDILKEKVNRIGLTSTLERLLKEAKKKPSRQKSLF